VIVLVIHAGGYSKRLPHVSAVGKIFTALPLGKNRSYFLSLHLSPIIPYCFSPPGDTVMQMLELKFVMFMHFPQKMLPGVKNPCSFVPLYCRKIALLFLS